MAAVSPGKAELRRKTFPIIGSIPQLCIKRFCLEIVKMIMNMEILLYFYFD